MPLRVPKRGHGNRSFLDCALLSFLATLWLVSRPIHAQPGSCDPLIKPPSLDSPYSYRQRTNRCEGIYARDVAGDVLMVASLTRQFDDFRPAAAGRLHLSWNLRRQAPVRLAAFSLRPRFYYRMDSLRPVGETAYDWSTDVLAALNVNKADLGVVATTSLPVGGSAQEVYLPLRVGVSPASKPGVVELILVSDAELSEVYVSVSLLGPDGRPVRTLRKNEALGYGDYPAQGGITVSFTNLDAAGFYQVDVGATLVSGGSSNLRFRIYQEGT